MIQPRFFALNIKIAFYQISLKFHFFVYLYKIKVEILKDVDFLIKNWIFMVIY